VNVGPLVSHLFGSGVLDGTTGLLYLDAARRPLVYLLGRALRAPRPGAARLTQPTWEEECL